LRSAIIFSVYRLETKKRVLQEFQESDISNERNRLEDAGNKYTIGAKKKETEFLREKVQLGILMNVTDIFVVLKVDLTYHIY
jgi:hypothetical protein